MNFLENIEQHQQTYSKTEQKVYQFVTNNLDILETYTITKIAEQSHTSTSAVLRFCQTLGYKGFKDFRYDAISFLHHHYKKDSVDQLDRILDNYSSLMNQFRTLDRTIIQKLIRSILTHKPLHIFGVHLSSLPAKFLYMGCQDLGIAGHFAGDLNSGAHLTNIINEEDTLIMFSISGNLANFKNSLSAIQNNMPKNSFLITLNEKSPLNKIFEHTIVLPGSLFNTQSIIDMQTVPMIFVDILMNLIHEELE